MSFWTLDSDRLVRIFHNNGMKMSLKKAFEIARIIEDLHSQRVIEVENNVWTVARKEIEERVRVAAETSHQEGYTLGQRQSNYMAEGEHVQRVIGATMWAERRFNDRNLSFKIKCIKKLREEFPLLGLRDCKNIVSRCSGSGYGITL
jgi:hypothetical protein